MTKAFLEEVLVARRLLVHPEGSGSQFFTIDQQTP
jgi:hypothetical protein